MAVGVFLDPFDADAGIAALGRQNHCRHPALDIAGGVLDGEQRAAPAGLGGQVFGRQFGDHAMPDAPAPVIAFQRALQRPRGHALQGRIDGGADGQSAAEEFILPEILRQLAADFIGEIVARRQLFGEGREIAILDRAQRLFGLGPIGRLVDIAVLPHLAQHIVAPLGHALLGFDRVIPPRRLRHRGQRRRLMRFQLRQGLVEIGLRGGGHAVAVLAEKDLVQIQLQDLVLGQRLFQPGGQDQFLDLAFDAAIRG